MRADTVITKVSENATESWVTSYGFLNPTADTTTTLVNSITYNTIGLSFSYSYNNLGNITEIKENNVLKASYEYDHLNQLIRENNAYLNKTVTYNYDNGGNILSKTIYDYTTGNLDGLTGTVVQYTYGDSNWKDKLTAYNGNTITYDAIGNPINYYNGTAFEWSNGRQLARATKTDGTYMSYRYNDSGVRIRKSVNGVATDYFVDGSTIIAEKTGNDTIWYYYDAAGLRVGFTYNNTPYYYIYNVQGDVIGLFNASQQIVARYNYDAWGKIISITDGSSAEITDTTHIAHVNPFRYRGYYYDAETELYYLNSRYYDPETGRFINADDNISAGNNMTGMNLFAYCGNNPLIRLDHGGQFWDTVFDVISLGASIVEVCVNPTDPWAWAGLAGDAIDLIPFVTGVGEVTRAVKTIDKVADTVQIAKAVDFTEDAADLVKTLDRSSGFTKSTASAGRKIHQGYKATNNFPKAGKEFREIKGIRPDYIDFNTRTIYELKPMNPRGVRSGIRQLQRYNKALGGGFNLRLELY